MKTSVAAGALLATLLGVQQPMPVFAAATGRLTADTSTTITTHEGTNLEVIISPDGQRLIMNLQGILFALQVTGGKATQISDRFLEPVKLDWSPDGERILMQSYRDGMFHMYTMRPDGSDLKQLSKGDVDDLDPRWSPDGTRIAFVSERSGNRDLWLMDLKANTARMITGAGDQGVGPDVSAPAGMLGVPSWIADPAWSPDGQQIAFVRNKALEVVDVKSGAVRTLIKGPVFDLAAPSWSRDGRHISLRQNAGLWVIDADGSNARRVGDKNDVFPFPATWLESGELLYSANGGIWVSALGGASRQIPFEVSFKLERPAYHRKTYDFSSVKPEPAKGMVGPQLSPDGKQAAFKALNDIWIYDIGGKAKRLTQDSYYEIDPAWSPDGTKLAYASDKSGSQDIYIRDLKSGKETRATHLPGAEVAPVWSNDGQQIAFLTQADEVAILTVASGETRTVMKGLNRPGKVSWSPDNKTLALAALHNARNQLLTIDIESGATRYQEIARGRSFSTRGDDGPVWSADGKNIVFSMGSVLWSAAVDANGILQGQPKRLTSHASDAPSLSRDGKRLLYLNNGVLTLLDLTSNTSQALDTGITWQQNPPKQRVLIQNVRVWDGVNEKPAEARDVLIVNDRIAEIRAHARATNDRNVRVIDGAGKTLVPGLFDMHNHQQSRSKFLGDRQGRAWLAYGVTSTRSTGDQVYRALEDKESMASGDRIGPRYFMTGEMFEGRSLEWEFARPVDSREQLALDLSRAKALGFDVIKTYVRFPFDYQAEVVRYAHDELGISVTSHYFYPGVAFGTDGAEHGGGPTRWEMSNTSGYYDDVMQAMKKTKFQVTTTNFSSAIGIAQDPRVVNDPRIEALYPQWERDSLHALLLCAQQKGPCGFLPPNDDWSRGSVQTMTKFHRAGITVMAGTDAPLDNYGIALQLNLRALARHGMTNFETLQVATIVPARAQAVDKDLGSIEVGKLADLVLVEGDPSKNMEDLINVRTVLKGGRVFSIEELMKPFVK